MTHDMDRLQAELNDLIESFETAHARQGSANVLEFLPPTDHPLYRTARLELLRVDLELNGSTGARSTLHDFTLLFPDLVHDRSAMQDLAFEEYRLRLLAGEQPSPEEYASNFGVDTTGWTVPTPNHATRSDSLLQLVGSLATEE